MYSAPRLLRFSLPRPLVTFATESTAASILGMVVLHAVGCL